MRRRALPVLFLLVGLTLLHGPMLRDGAGRVHGNMVDGRLVALLLEHALTVSSSALIQEYRWAFMTLTLPGGT